MSALGGDVRPPRRKSGFGPPTGHGHSRTSALCYKNIQFPRARGCILSSEHVERRLAAILAADVVGSCRLIGIDEEGTLAQLKALRKTLFDPKIAASRTYRQEHRGRRSR